MEPGTVAATISRTGNPGRPFLFLRLLDALGYRLVRGVRLTHGLLAFAVITLGVALGKAGKSTRVIFPMVRSQTYRAGIRLLPMTTFLACMLGFLIIGQMIALLSRVGVHDLAGALMVTVVVREAGPLAAAILVLMRVGTAFVVELGTSRALGEVEALEALGIDPIHYLVVPRITALALSIFSLSIYFILVTVVSGYVFAFLQDVPLLPGDYFKQLGTALGWVDFVLLPLKTLFFGLIIGIITCYQGLARPLRIEEVAGATTRAVVQSVVACVSLDAVFIVAYFLR